MRIQQCVWRDFSRTVLLVLSLMLAGCMATPPRPAPGFKSGGQLEAFSIEGRFSLRQDNRNHSGRLTWKHASAGDEILLSSPFGQGIAAIVVNAETAMLTTHDGKVYSAPDAPTLTEQVLGYRLPLALLTDWVRGRNTEAAHVERDTSGRPVRLRHEDWVVEYGYDSDDPLAPPGRLFAERLGAFELRLRIDEWIVLPTRETAP